MRLHTIHKISPSSFFSCKNEGNKKKILKAEQEKEFINIMILHNFHHNIEYFFFHPTRVFTNFMFFFLCSNFIFNFLLNCYLEVINVLFFRGSLFILIFCFAYLHNTVKYEIHHWTYESRLFHLKGWGWYERGQDEERKPSDRLKTD